MTRRTQGLAVIAVISASTFSRGRRGLPRARGAARSSSFRPALATGVPSNPAPPLSCSSGVWGKMARRSAPQTSPRGCAPGHPPPRPAHRRASPFLLARAPLAARRLAVGGGEEGAEVRSPQGPGGTVHPDPLPPPRGAAWAAPPPLPHAPPAHRSPDPPVTERG